MITFRINKSDCFDEKTKDVTIIQGNSAEINTEIIDDETGKSIILEEGDAILWFVRSATGTFRTKRIFTSENMNEDGSLTLRLKPIDTVNIKPHPTAYEYGLTLILANGEEAYTYCQGHFIVKPGCGTINDLID